MSWSLEYEEFEQLNKITKSLNSIEDQAFLLSILEKLAIAEGKLMAYERMFDKKEVDS